MTSSPAWHERPNRIPWPPLIFAAAALAAVLLGYASPVPLPGAGMPPVTPGLSRAGRLIGGAGMLCGVGLDLAAMLTLRRHRANILPHRAATALVTSGPFAWSRNPIYLGNTLLLAGAGPIFGNAWFLPAAALAAWAVGRLAIRREEAHLAARFGRAWQDYAARVPRWIGL